MGELWVTSDTHFGHANICKGTTKWGPEAKTRDFKTVKEMDQCIIDNINKVVRPDDTLLHLGDFSFGGTGNVYKYRGLIKCENIHLVYGNHCNKIRKDPSLQAIFASCQDFLIKKVGPYQVVCCHYALRVFPWMHKGQTFHLFGHSHGNLKERTPRSWDCGVDNNNLQPLHVLTLIEQLKQEPVAILDHHGT